MRARWFGLLAICGLMCLLPMLYGAETAGRVLKVGPSQPLAKPSQAAAVAQDGDTIEIAAGTYTGDVAVWRANRLTIKGVGGRAVLDAAGKSAGQKAIWVITGRDTTIEDIEFTGCTVPDKNGAGIRQEGPNLTVRRCYFHHNEDGILTGANPDSEIRLENCEFGSNGFGDGYSHNLYIGKVRRFVMQGCYSHHAKVGHLVKSRAEENLILYNRITDEADGNSSYLIDIPNGGHTIILGNLLQHGPRAENGTAVSYAAEGAKNAVQELYVAHNTFVNARHTGQFLRVAGTPAAARIVNNLVVGTEVLFSGNSDADHNVLTKTPGFADPAVFDYRLRNGSPALGAGVDPGKAGELSLTPELEYVHPCNTRPRKPETPPTAGACTLLPDGEGTAPGK